MKKLILIVSFILSLVASTAYAAPDIQYQTNVAPFIDNTFDNGTSTNVWKNIWTNALHMPSQADGCATFSSGLLTSTGLVCGSGGGGSGGGTFSTSTINGLLTQYPYTTLVTSLDGSATTTSDWWFDPFISKTFWSYGSSTASTFGNLFITSPSQGFAFLGTNGLLSSIASSSIKLSWFNNDAGFITSSASTTLLSDTNNWTGRNTFANSTSTNLGTTNFYANSSAGMNLHANNGTDIAILGAGNTANSTFYGGVNIDGATRLATSLTGILKASSGTVSTAVSGTDLKTINGTSIIGSGDITVSGGTSAYEIATTSGLTVPQLAYFTQASGRTTLGGISTTTVSCSGTVSCTQFTTLGASPITITGSGGSGASPDWQKITDPFNVTALTPTTTIPLYIQGSATSSFAGKMVIGSSTGSYARCFLCVTGTENAYMQFNIQNKSAGSSASTDIVATADNGSDSTHYIDLGINGSNGASTPFSTANHGYLYTIDDPLNIGALGASSYITFNTTGGTSPVERLRITSTGSLVLATTTKGILRTDASGTIYASSATTTPISLFNGFTTPDSNCTSSACSWVQPSIINAPASIYGGMVYIASSTTAKTGFYSLVHIPSNFASSTSQVSINWTATSTSNSVVFDFDYRCVGGNNTTSLYQTSWQESTTTTVANPSTAGYRKTTTFNLNTGYWCSADDSMELYITRDGADGADTSTVDTEIYDATIVFPTQ